MVLAALIARSEPGDRCSIGDEDQAARRGMHGSPTILIDGIDPFAVPGQPASVSCRLYRDSDGRADGAPSVRQLRRAIRHPVTIREIADRDGAFVRVNLRSW